MQRFASGMLHDRQALQQVAVQDYAAAGKSKLIQTAENAYDSATVQNSTHQLNILPLPKQCEALHAQPHGVAACVYVQHPEEERSPALALAARYLH